MHGCSSSHQFLAEHISGSTPEISNHPSGTLHNQRTGSHIPGVKPVFVKCLKTPTGHISQVGSS